MHSIQLQGDKGALLLRLCPVGALSLRPSAAWANLLPYSTKCTVFGINCEAIPRQVNFLTDEAGDCGKGANAVVSRLHYFFHHHGLGEKHAFLHADNCCGQNKNNCMVHYLVWCTLTNRHSNITLSFLPVGHTKFSPDWCFGLLKRQYRRTKVGSLQAIAEVVSKSAECNHTQLVS